MPYRRRRRYGGYRRRRYLSRVNIYSRKSASSQAKQIGFLNKKVKTLARKDKDRAQFVQFKASYQALGITHGFNLPSTWQPAVKKLINPSGGWTPVFQTPTTAGNDKTNKFRGRSIGVEHMFQIEDPSGSEGDPVTLTLFCVTLRKEAAKQFVNDTSNGTTLIQNQHYTMTSMGIVQGHGMVFLNKGIFKVRYVKRFMLGSNIDFNDSTENTTNLRDNNRRIYHKIRYPNVIKSTVGTKGYAQLNEAEVELTDQVYYYLFHNAYEAQAVSWNMNAIITGRETN